MKTVPGPKRHPKELSRAPEDEDTKIMPALLHNKEPHRRSEANLKAQIFKTLVIVALAATFRELADLLNKDAPAYEAWLKTKKSERNHMTPP